MQIVHKAAVPLDNLEFILSDATKDRYGDVIEASGWDLRNFKRNPIALFGHSQDYPIGRWENLRVEGGKLIGKLVLAARGTSARLDEIISLIEQGILRAVSVGFRALEREPIGDGGIRFTKQELLETSVVSVPANPAAVSLVKSLNISAETRALVFGESAERTNASGSSVDRRERHSPSQTQGNTKMSLSARIEATQTRLVGLQDELQRHLDTLPDDPTEDQNVVTSELNEKIGNVQENLRNLQEAEQRLANAGVTRSAVVVESRGQGGNGAGTGTTADLDSTGRKPWAAPAKKVEPLDYVFRALTVKTVAHVLRQNEVETLKQLYGEDVTTKAVSDIVLRAAVAPADTATPAWAGALVQTAVGDFFDLLLPTSVYPQLAAIGGRFDFGRNGTVSLPTRDATPTVAGSFVGEGSPIPVRRAGFSSVTLTPKKMAVITTMTREITERSTPQIEGLLRNAIQEDTAVSIDTVLLDNGAATTIRPAGLRNSVTTAAGTAGGGIAAVLADVKAMLTALITATNGNLRRPVWIMNEVQAVALSLITNAGGDFVFQGDLARNVFQGYPVIRSTTVPAGVVMLIDAADFFSATGDDPRFDVSDQATLHMEDTTPAQIGTAGTPNVVAAPVRSMFQTDSLALRMILPMNWAMRRTGVIVERTGVTW